MDSQCTANRSGILCGHCKDNFSLVLGSNRCLPDCSYNSLSLFVVLVFAGITLVLFIKIANLTISQGTLNGLIFYANIIGASQFIFFPNSEIRLVNFLATFIAWVNLDLGIQTCFLPGMGSTTKAWLQFVFSSLHLGHCFLNHCSIPLFYVYLDLDCLAIIQFKY